MIFFFNTLLQIFKHIIFLILSLYDFNNFFNQVLPILTGSIINESICFFIASDIESASDSASDSSTDSDADFEEIRKDLVDSMDEDAKSKAKDEADPEGKAGRLAVDAAEVGAARITPRTAKVEFEIVEFEFYLEAESEGFSGTELLSKKRKRED